MAAYGLEKKTDAELKEITNRIVHEVLDNGKLSINQIILYGSYATGTANDESDIDIMVLCNNNRDEVNEYGKVIARIIDHIGYDCDIFAHGKVEAKMFFDEWYKTLPFFQNVIKDGVILYG